MLPEPTRRRTPADGPTTPERGPDPLRSGVEHLLTSTLTLLRQLRDVGLLTGTVRHQAILVAVDGGRLELALDAAHPDATPSETHAVRQAQRRQLLRDTLAAADTVDDAVATLLSGDPQAIERGEIALSLIDVDPELASDVADRLDGRTGASSLRGS